MNIIIERTQTMKAYIIQDIQQNNINTKYLKNKKTFITHNYDTPKKDLFKIKTCKVHDAISYDDSE